MTAGEYEVGHLTLFSDTAIKGRELQESGSPATLKTHCPEAVLLQAWPTVLSAGFGGFLLTRVSRAFAHKY